MRRNVCSKLLFLIKMAIVAALSTYTATNAAPTMSNMGSTDTLQYMSQCIANHGAEVMPPHHHSKAYDDSNAEKLSKMECCKNFCSGFVLAALSSILGIVDSSTIHEFTNDSETFNEIPPLNRPPNM